MEYAAGAELVGFTMIAGVSVAHLAVRGETGRQVRRNFGETLPIALACFAFLFLTRTIGEYSEVGALLYAGGRVGYLALTPRPVRAARRYAWALSVAGLVGLVTQVVAGAAAMLG